MKTLLSAFFLASLPLHSANLERVESSHIGLTAQLASNVGRATDHFKTDYGSSDIHTDKERKITGSVRNFGRETAEVGIKVVWIGKRVRDKTRFILATETTITKIPAGAEHHLLSFSGPVTGSDLKLVAIGERYAQGETIEGWVVTVRDAGGDIALPKEALLAIKGSDTHLEEYARTPGMVPALRKDILSYKVCHTDAAGFLAVTPGGYVFHLKTSSPSPTTTVMRATLTLLDSKYEWAQVPGRPDLQPEYSDGTLAREVWASSTSTVADGIVTTVKTIKRADGTTETTTTRRAR